MGQTLGRCRRADENPPQMDIEQALRRLWKQAN
jgi:hypothetical protein